MALSKQEGMLLIFTHFFKNHLEEKYHEFCFSRMFLIATQEYMKTLIQFLRSEGVRQDTVRTFTVQNFCRQHINFTGEKEENDIPLDLKKQS